MAMLLVAAPYESAVALPDWPVTRRSQVPDPERAKKVFSRVDRGHCTHGRATYVSEKYYGPEMTGGNIGDSACT
jgi:hypothetical protein